MVELKKNNSDKLYGKILQTSAELDEIIARNRIISVVETNSDMIAFREAGRSVTICFLTMLKPIYNLHIKTLELMLEANKELTMSLFYAQGPHYWFVFDNKIYGYDRDTSKLYKMEEVKFYRIVENKISMAKTLAYTNSISRCAIASHTRYDSILNMFMRCIGHNYGHNSIINRKAYKSFNMLRIPRGNLYRPYLENPVRDVQTAAEQLNPLLLKGYGAIKAKRGELAKFEIVEIPVNIDEINKIRKV